MTQVSGAYLARFMRSTALLALPSETQAAWLAALELPGEPAYADELATEFDDGVGLLTQFVAAGWLRQDAADRLMAVDALLDDMSGPGRENLWTIEALAVAPEWEAVRVAARQALLVV
ncbi:hypothetical protein [Actinophytocola gossypii]|uniref:Uncharacterized protein n=1 Tax=Actinophytocola gossypii TaxID=2812003 RepID=A0ABT2JJA7_9PSEU|nr:hypothetical protein [Actinophytocola gossypii]MCT2587968.1 hypothetical protein [Actinophytocola gossypii]